MQGFDAATWMVIALQASGWGSGCCNHGHPCWQRQPACLPRVVHDGNTGRACLSWCVSGGQPACCQRHPRPALFLGQATQARAPPPPPTPHARERTHTHTHTRALPRPHPHLQVFGGLVTGMVVK